MPPAAKNPFVKGFLDLPKLFIRYFALPYLLALLRVSSRFTKIGGGFRAFGSPRSCPGNRAVTRKKIDIFFPL
jgi:hypothetical protein